MTSVFPSAVYHCLWFPNTGWQPHVSRFTLCSPNLDSLCNFMFLCCASTPDLSQLLICSVAVLCWTNVGHYTVFCLRSSCIQSFCHELDFLKYCENSHTSNAPFSGIWNSGIKFSHPRSLFSNKYFPFLVFERFYNHYSLCNGPSLPLLMIADHFIACALPIICSFLVPFCLLVIFYLQNLIVEMLLHGLSLV